jgi:hypothetical protein
MRFLTLLFLFCSFLFVSCSEIDPITPTAEQNNSLVFPEFELLTTPQALVDGLFLPVGTEITKGETENTLLYRLPEGYANLWYDKTTKRTTIQKSGQGSYTCTCSGGGTCTAFVIPGQGPGCLQNTCDATCSGKVTNPDDAKSNSTRNLQLIGIVPISEEILPGIAEVEAQIIPGFREKLFDLEEVETAIQDHYRFVYNKYQAPDFSALTPSNLPEGYAMGTVNIFGLNFGMVFPAEKDFFEEFFPPGTYSLSNGHAKSLLDFYCTTSAPGCTCEASKRCLLGNCVYMCDGCNPCTIHYQ